MPPAPAKETDSRTANWDGLGQVELDAVKPEKLIALLDDAINEIFDQDLYDELIATEAEERELFQAELNDTLRKICKTEPGGFPATNKLSKNEREKRNRKRNADTVGKVVCIIESQDVKRRRVDVHYEVTETIGNESYTNKYHVESAKDIHPDLRECFDRLRPIMGRIFNITSFCQWSKPTILRRTRTKKGRSPAISPTKMLKNIKVLGVSYSGQDDNVGVVLTGLFTVSNNQKTAINSPRLKFNTETFGFEEELEAIVADIENEVYAFLFKGKRRNWNCSG